MTFAPLFMTFAPLFMTDGTLRVSDEAFAVTDGAVSAALRGVAGVGTKIFKNRLAISRDFPLNRTLAAQFRLKHPIQPFGTMATWNSPTPQFWNQPGLMWSQPDAPSNPPHPMFEVVLNVARLGLEAFLVRVESIVSKMTGNSAFPTPAPALADLTAQVAAIRAKRTARDAAKASAKQLTTELKALSKTLRGDLEELADYVGKTATTEAQVQSADMALKAAATPAQQLDAPQNLSLSYGDDDGALDASVDAEPEADFYEWHIALDAANPVWTHKATSPGSSETLEDLPSGQKICVRARTHNAAGYSPWSDIAIKRAP